MNKKVTTVVVAPQLTEQLNQQVLDIIEIAQGWQTIHGKETLEYLDGYLKSMQRQTTCSLDFEQFGQDERLVFMAFMQDLEKVTKLMCKLPPLVTALEQHTPTAKTA